MDKNEKLENIYFFQLERTVRQFRKFSQREMQKRGLDISGEQWVVLKRALEEPGLSQKQIADSTYKDPASITRMIDLLVNRGFLERKANEDDRRSFGIFLTEKGSEFVQKVLPIAVEMRKYGLRGVSNQDKATFVKVLNRIHDNLE